MKVALPVLLAFTLLVFLAPVPAGHATTAGPYDLYVHYSVTGYNPFNAYQSYPGGTVYFNYVFIDSETSGSITITQIELTTPWQTYSDTSLPVTIAQGDEYYGYFAITIPSSESLGNSSWTFADSEINFNPSTDQLVFTVYANPTTLQTEIDSLNTQVTSLQSQVSSLQSQLTAAQNSAASLQGTVTTLQGQVSTLQSQLSAAQNNATNLQNSVNSLNTQLTATQSQLSNATAKVSTLTTQLQTAQSEISNKTAQITTLSSQLSTTQASLATANTNLATTNAKLTVSQGEVATYSTLYLPAGVAVPTIVAILLLVLYMRKGSRPSAAMGASQPKAASQAGAETNSNFCPDCGTANKVGAKFCAKCGSNLT